MSWYVPLPPSPTYKTSVSYQIQGRLQNRRLYATSVISNLKLIGDFFCQPANLSKIEMFHKYHSNWTKFCRKWGICLIQQLRNLPPFLTVCLTCCFSAPRGVVGSEDIGNPSSPSLHLLASWVSRASRLLSGPLGDRWWSRNSDVIGVQSLGSRKEVESVMKHFKISGGYSEPEGD